jgi:hypothetical protein
MDPAVTPEGMVAFNEAVNSITVFSLGAVIIIALVRGLVLTRRHHDDVMRIMSEALADMKAQRDEAIAGWKAQTEATDKLTEVVGRLGGAVTRLSSRHRAYDGAGADDRPEKT